MRDLEDYSEVSPRNPVRIAPASSFVMLRLLRNRNVFTCTFVLFVLAGIAAGILLVALGDPIPRKDHFLKVAGGVCIVFYGTLLTVFIKKIRAGTWGAACDYLKLLFSDPGKVIPPFIGIPQQENVCTGVQIRRVFDLCGLARGLQIFIDGKEVVQLAYGSTRTIPLPPGVHEMYVQMDWCRSESVTVEICEDMLLDLKCGCRFRFIFPFNIVLLALCPERSFFLNSV